MGAALVVGSIIAGVVVGSFLNVVVARVPEGQSIVRPPSRCPSCGTTLARRDNIPVVSWLVLRARCRTCRAPIPIRYPLLELGTGALWGVLAAGIGARWFLPGALAFFTGVIAMVAIGLERRPRPAALAHVTGGIVAVALVGSAAATADAGSLAAAVGTAIAAWCVTVWMRILPALGAIALGVGIFPLVLLL